LLEKDCNPENHQNVCFIRHGLTEPWTRRIVVYNYLFAG
jgi:hypothetical protein